MEQIQQQIQLFHNLFLVCMGLCIFFLVLSVMLFFKFDIRNIFNVRTGRSVKKTIKEMEEVNARTGQLRRTSPSAGTSKRLNKVRKVDLQDVVQNPKTSSNLASGQDSTEVLTESTGGYTLEAAQADVDERYGRFEIIAGVMLIHTEEAV
ncbi:hypothetical protein PMF13cell1_01267 [Blautia producta]|uniref:Uncharacterized protein n=1 Tax=Blautia producta TaxID=33035 RepID=A0A4P6LX83_9FIRM|nr:hypothetical protein [Blautia producta]QBE95743.1 hypothetical protein PMF13cell1_01267 [Blautia producta]